MPLKDIYSFYIYLNFTEVCKSLKCELKLHPYTVTALFTVPALYAVTVLYTVADQYTATALYTFTVLAVEAVLVTFQSCHVSVRKLLMTNIVSELVTAVDSILAVSRYKAQVYA